MTGWRLVRIRPTIAAFGAVLGAAVVLHGQSPGTSDWTEPVCQALSTAGAHTIEWEWSADKPVTGHFEVRQWRPPAKSGPTFPIAADVARSNPNKKPWATLWVDAPGTYCWSVRAVAATKKPIDPPPTPAAPPKVAAREPVPPPGPTVPTTMRVVQRVNTPTNTRGASLSTPAFPAPPTAGNLLVVLVQYQQSGGTITATAVKDQLDNSYVATPASPFANSPGGSAPRNIQAIYYAKNVKGGAANAVTVTFPSEIDYGVITAFEISGADKANPYLTGAGETGASGNAVSAGTLAIRQEAILIAMLESDAAGFTGAVPTPFSGFTQAKADDRGFFWDTYKVVTSSEAAGATAPPGAGKWGVLAAAFKAAGKGP